MDSLLVDIDNVVHCFPSFFRYEELRITMSQELEQRSVMVTYSVDQIVDDSIELQMHNDKIQYSGQNNFQTEQPITKILSPYKALNDPANFDDIANHVPQATDNEVPISIIPQTGFEGNINLNQPSLHPFLLQSQFFRDATEIVEYPSQEQTNQFIPRYISEVPLTQEISEDNQIGGSYDNGHNVLMATEKSIPDQTTQSTIDTCALIQGVNNNMAIVEPSNIAMMIQHRPIAPAHASPVVYAEAANTAILSSSAVHHQLYTEDVGNNNNNNNNAVENEDNNDTRRDILKEHALTHGYESGV